MRLLSFNNHQGQVVFNGSVLVQYRIRNQVGGVSKGLATATVILMIIPYIGMLSFLILAPIMAGQMQAACNKLAMLRMTEQ